MIGNINASFNYSFKINEASNIDFTYYIVGKLVILNSDGSKMFSNKEYKLSEEKHLILIDEKNINIAQNISIDYEYYNSIANQFRQQYGINAISYLELSLIVNGHELDNIFDLNSNYSRSIRIPLSEHEVDIKIDDDNVSNVSKTISKNKLLVSNKIYITVGFVSLIVAIICFVKIVNNILIVVIPKKSKYDKYVNKILREYDRLIVNTVTAPDLVNYKITKIGSFTELLDVRDNLRLPIKYYVVTEHQKSIFYITHRDEIYILIVKAVDIENS